MSCRKKIDAKQWVSYTQLMESEVRSLKQELERTREALKLATKRCRDLVRELDHRTVSHDTERSLQDQQLSRILRALLVVEGRLKQEQKSIRQLLCEKDNVIRNQQLEIAKLRRYTKNYIKCKRDNTPCKDVLDTDNESVEIMSNDLHSIFSKSDVSRSDSSLSKDIRTLKCEIITKLNEDSDQDHGLRKAHSFAESDVSKTSITSSEITDTSMTTTDSSPSMLSTEGFCEGESTDVSPGSTLNKSTRCTPISVTDELLSSDNEVNADERPELPKRKMSIIRGKLNKESMRSEFKGGHGVTRTDSKDDGMDCNFISDEEPVYENTPYLDKDVNDVSNNSTELTMNNINRSDRVETVQQPMEQNLEENSGNWYSDPDEDKASDEVFRHRAYQPNSKHNSVLECVNQILLRDMEEEENVLSVPRRFKHRGRIVHFQPARLSDIESVGSEMERRNSEENVLERIGEQGQDHSLGFALENSEKDFRTSAVKSISESPRESITEVLSTPNVDFEGSKAIPLVIIEPKVEPDVGTGETPATTPQKMKSCADLMKSSLSHTSSPPSKMERMEEKACSQMSSIRLTIAKNLDYEDIESLPDSSNGVKTPPALPPKPQYKNNTLILKKIPSPSFLINETHKKQGGGDNTSDHDVKFFNFSTSPAKSGPTYIAIRSGKHSSSTASTHAADFERLLNIESFKEIMVNGEGVVKPVVIMSVDGGPDENPRYPKVIVHAIDHFLKHDLDAIFVFTNAPGRSAYNRVERRMAPLSRELSGVILQHDHFGSHLSDSGKTIDVDLEKKNFEHAGNVLADIWSQMSIDGHDVKAEFIRPGENISLPDFPSVQWYANHVRESQYFLQVVKCNDLTCCNEIRSGLQLVLPNRFMPPPYSLIQTSKGPAVPLPDDSKNQFASLLVRSIVNVKPAHDGFIAMPYDFYCPSVKQQLNDRTCDVCGLYFTSKKGVRCHKKQLHGRAVSATSKIRPLRVVRRRAQELLCELPTDDVNVEPHTVTWVQEKDVDLHEKVTVPNEISTTAADESLPIIKYIQGWTENPFEEDIDLC